MEINLEPLIGTKDEKSHLRIAEENFLYAIGECAKEIDTELKEEYERIRMNHSAGVPSQIEFTDSQWKNDPFGNTDYMKLVFIFSYLHRSWSLCILPGTHDECKEIYWNKLFKNYPKLWEFTALCVWG